MKSALEYLQKGTLQRYAQVLLSTNEEIFLAMTLKLTRREMIEALGGGVGLVGLAGVFAGLSRDDVQAAGLGNYAGPALPAKAKHVIMLFMTGGPSQLDMFDPKPALAKYAGQRPSAVDLRTERTTGGLLPSPFEFKRYGRNGVEVSELLPQLASVIDDVCVIRSMYTFNPTHTPARACSTPAPCSPHRPSMGSWISYGLGTENETCRRSLRSGSTAADRRRAVGIPAGRASGHRFQITDPDPENMIPNLRNKQLDATAQRADLDALHGPQPAITQSRSAPTSFSKAASSRWRRPIACSSKRWTLFDIRKEPESIREEYGNTVVRHRLPARASAGRARRALRPRATIRADKSGTTTSDVNDNLRKRCPDMDQAAAALIRDLKRRGLLDETLVVWGGEFGRTPVSESGTGRDHNPYGYTMLVAGGGFKGGLAYGATDEFGFKAEQNRVSIHDLHATLLHQLGMDHTKLTYRYAGRDFRLTDVFGEVVKDILV